jgi:CDP-glucose 4,6-dehydratase
MVMDKSFWKDKKVLITGHTGFKGSWLSLWLQRMEANVIGYSLPPPTKPSLFEVGHVADGMVSITGDVCDLEQVQATIAKHEPEIIFHMAAQSLVHYSYAHPVETYSTNVMGAVNVLEAIRHSRCVRVVIIVTSDKCYENNEGLWGYREIDPMGGYDPYSSSKGCVELITSGYRSSFFSKGGFLDQETWVATVRAGNVIGGGDWAKDRLIPDIMKAMMESRVVVIRNPDAIRPWQHVLEPLCGYLMLVERLWSRRKEFDGAWNFGPDDKDAKPVSWVAEFVTNLWGQGARWELDPNEHRHEARYLKLDCSKAKSLLGWKPKLNICKTLEWIVDWYRSYKESKDMRDITEDHIVRFENL